MSGTIVVGVDGSPTSLIALGWARDEARLRGASLRVVTVWEPATLASMGIPGGMVPPDMSEQLEQGAEEIQAEALAQAGIDNEKDKVEAMIREGAPVRVLLEAAADADMLVIGSRGHGGFKELMLGSVSQQCAHHAACPVVIVRHVHEEGS